MRTSISSVIAVVAILATILPVDARVLTLDTRTVGSIASPNVRTPHKGLEVRVAQDRVEEDDSEVPQTSTSARPTKTTSISNSEKEDAEKRPTPTSSKNVDNSTRTIEDEYRPTAGAGKKVEGEVPATETSK
jgi:hypothetical protein